MKRLLVLAVAVELLIGACGTAETGASTTFETNTPTTSSTTLSSTTTSTPAASTPSSSATTEPPTTTTPTGAPGLPIDDDWAVTTVEWGVQPAQGDLPAVGPASPESPIPPDGWPADGYYDVGVARTFDPPGVVAMAIRRWVSCDDLPDRCPPEPPSDGVVADPATEVERVVFIGELTVVIRPLQRLVDGALPNPPTAITAAGAAFYELLSGWCGGYIEPGATRNCGLDHATWDWIWNWDSEGVRAPADELVEELTQLGADSGFPFGVFDDGSSTTPCGADRRCPIAYRGPQGAHLVADIFGAEVSARWPHELYGWWTTLEVRNGRPILYIDAGQVAG